jgi:hypothetical protein
MKIDKELVCELFQLKYMSELGYNPNDFEKVYKEIYPIGWLENDDYDFKIKLLTEAIAEKKLVSETEQYKAEVRNKIF